jgi:hypothetical protein
MIGTPSPGHWHETPFGFATLRKRKVRTDRGTHCSGVALLVFLKLPLLSVRPPLFETFLAGGEMVADAFPIVSRFEDSYLFGIVSVNPMRLTANGSFDSFGSQR